MDGRIGGRSEAEEEQRNEEEREEKRKNGLQNEADVAEENQSIHEPEF